MNLYVNEDDKRAKIAETLSDPNYGFFLYFIDKRDAFNAGGWPAQPDKMFKPIYQLSFETICRNIMEPRCILLDLYSAITED